MKQKPSQTTERDFIGDFAAESELRQLSKPADSSAARKILPL